MGQTSPNIQTFASALGAAYKVYSIIDHVSSATFSLYLFAAALLSICITELALLCSGTLGSRFKAANNLDSVMLDFTLIGKPAVCMKLAGHLGQTLHFPNLISLSGFSSLSKKKSNLSNIIKQLFTVKLEVIVVSEILDHS